MAVHTSSFGSIRLTGDDARKFATKIKSSRSSAKATASYERGVRLLDEFRRSGSVVVKLSKKK